jgi:hypothetical protein
MKMIAKPLVERAALTQSFNEAWFVLGAGFVLALCLLPFVRSGNAVRGVGVRP